MTEKCILCFCAGVVTGVAVHMVFSARRKRSHDPSCDDDDMVSQVLFFPDAAALAVGGGESKRSRGHYLYREILYKECMKEEASLATLIRTLESARHSIDLCLYVVNSHQLAEAVLGHLQKKKNTGFRVRLVVDESCVASAGSAVPKFRSRGAFVRSPAAATSHDGYLMHHKFVVIDNRLLITGSFNWTMQAIMGNKENVIISSDQRLVQPFVKEFQKIWNEFSPDAPSSSGDKM